MPSLLSNDLQLDNVINLFHISRCVPELLCYAINKDPMLPWFYDGICVSNETYHRLPTEPEPCDCDRLLWEQNTLTDNSTVELPPPVTERPALIQPPTVPSSDVAEENKHPQINSFISWTRNHLKDDLSDED